MPGFIVVVASLVTIVQFLLEGYVPDLYASLGLYIPLIVVNCIILGRAESYASKNGPILSVFDGIGMGFGFTIALTVSALFVKSLVQDRLLVYRFFLLQMRLPVHPALLRSQFLCLRPVRSLYLQC